MDDNSLLNIALKALASNPALALGVGIGVGVGGVVIAARRFAPKGKPGGGDDRTDKELVLELLRTMRTVRELEREVYALKQVKDDLPQDG